MKYKEIVSILIANSWDIKRKSRGSHAIYSKPGKRDLIIPIHSKEMKTGTAQTILKIARS